MISNYTKQGSDKHGATSEYQASYVCRCALKKEEHSRVFSDERLTLETSAFESIRPVDETTLSWNTAHRRSTTVSLETFPLNSCVLFKYFLWTEVPFIQEVSGLYTSLSPYIQIDSKWLCEPEKFSVLLRNRPPGPGSTLTEVLIMFFTAFV